MRFGRMFTMNMTQNTTQHLDLNYCPPPPPPLPVFEEELIVFNACPTCKLTKFKTVSKGKKGKKGKYVNRYISHTPGVKKNGSSKMYKVHFKGNFFRFSELMRLLSAYGLTWMRNSCWYRNEKTGENYHPSNFILVDFDDLGIQTGEAIVRYDCEHVKTCLVIESSSNETVFYYEEEYIEEYGDNIEYLVADNYNGKTKFHVFLKTAPFNYDNETLRQKVTEETGYIFGHEVINTAKEARKKLEEGLPLTYDDKYALETAWDPQAAYVTQKTFSVLNSALLDKYPERFHLAYQAEREIGLVYTLNDFPSIFKGLAECVTVEPLLSFPKPPLTHIKQQQDIAEISLEENYDNPKANPQVNPPYNPPVDAELPPPSPLTHIKQQQDTADFKTWFSKREKYSDAPFILMSSSRILMEIVDKRNLPREASYPIAHWGNIYLNQNLQRPIKVGARHKRVDLQIIALCYNARALATYFDIDLDTDSTLSYDGIIRQVNWIVQRTTELSGADERNPMDFTWIAQKVYHWLFVATTEEMTKALSTSLMRMDKRIVPNWDINISEFEQLCSSDSSTKEECFKAANAKWRISKAVFNGLWRKAGIAQKQAHRPRTRRNMCKVPLLMKPPQKAPSKA